MQAESLAQPYYVPDCNSINATPSLDSSSPSDDARTSIGNECSGDPRQGMGVNALRWLRLLVRCRDNHFGGAAFPRLPGADDVVVSTAADGEEGVDSDVDAVDIAAATFSAAVPLPAAAAAAAAAAVASASAAAGISPAAGTLSAAACTQAAAVAAAADGVGDHAVGLVGTAAASSASSAGVAVAGVDAAGGGGPNTASSVADTAPGAGKAEAGDSTGATRLAGTGGGARSIKAAKHAAQETAVVNHLQAAQMLTDTNAFCFVEFGAAQGGLGQAIRRELADSTVVLVERDVYGPKTDRFWLTPEEKPMLRSTAAIGAALATKTDFARARIDIRHLEVGKLPLIGERPVVAVAKHLCGVATDLTLTALKNRMAQVNHSCAGVMICTCCHALMKWEDFPEVSRRWLSEVVGSTVEKQQFELMRRCTGWQNDGGHTAATSKTLSKRKAARDALRDRAEKEVAAGVVGGLATAELEQEMRDAAAVRASREWRADIDDDEREVIGRCCKQLLDGSRRAAVRASGLRCELVQYIDACITPENTLLVAWDDTLCTVDL